ncbi:MAG: hypothetical protein AAGH68_04445 [Pseudomonadota bacterium]
MNDNDKPTELTDSELQEAEGGGAKRRVDRSPPVLFLPSATEAEGGSSNAGSATPLLAKGLSNNEEVK